jgi:hypothetical protein
MEALIREIVGEAEYLRLNCQRDRKRQMFFSNPFPQVERTLSMSSKISSHRHLNPDQLRFIKSHASGSFLSGGALGRKRAKEVARLFAKRFRTRIHCETVRRVLLNYRNLRSNGDENGDRKLSKEYKSTPVFLKRRNCRNCVH